MGGKLRAYVKHKVEYLWMSFRLQTVVIADYSVDKKNVFKFKVENLFHPRKAEQTSLSLS